MTVAAQIVDLDDEATWPGPVLSFVDEHARRLEGSAKFTVDLGGGLIEREHEFCSLFAGRRLLAFHATSLFDHEVEDIRRGRLRLLTPALVEDKISDAYARGHISASERDRCGEENVYAIHATAGRDGRICLVIGRSIFDRDAGGLTPFLGGWGGEAINGGPGPGEDPVLRRLGVPAIVVAAIDVHAGGRPAYSAPSLPKVFVGKRLGLEDAQGEIHVTTDIGGGDVLDIWQPGDTGYDRHPALPRGRTY
jgi:hypothetical protein